MLELTANQIYWETKVGGQVSLHQLTIPLAGTEGNPSVRDGPTTLAGGFLCYTGVGGVSERLELLLQPRHRQPNLLGHLRQVRGGLAGVEPEGTIQ